MTLVLLVCATLLSSNTLHAETQANRDLELARVNGQPVTANELVAVFSDRHSGHAKFLGGDVEARKFLDIVIDDRLLTQEGYEIGLDRDPTVLQYLEEFERDKTTQYLLARELDEKARVTKEDVREAWQHLDFVVQGRQIVLETRADAEEVRRSLLQGSDPEMLARLCSTGDSSKHGGNVIAGWGQYDPEWESIVFSLNDGEVSPVIVTPQGYEVVVRLARIDVPRPDFDRVASSIESALARRKLEARKSAYSAQLWTKYHVTMNPSLILTPASLARLDGETILAAWDNGGKLTLKDTASSDELTSWKALPPRRAELEIQERIRKTVNSSLVAMDARELKLTEVPQIAREIDEYRDYLVEAILYRDHIFRDLKITEDEIAKYYDEHKKSFEQPEKRHVAQILCASEADAKTVRQKLAAGDDFLEIVKNYSRDYTTVSSRGDLGWITADQVPTAFAEVLTLAVNGISQPMKDAQGWHVIKVLEIQPRQPMPLDAVQERVKTQVTDARKRAIRQHWIDKLRAAAKIEINGGNIKQFVADNSLGDANTAPSLQHAVPAAAPSDHHAQ